MPAFISAVGGFLFALAFAIAGYVSPQWTWAAVALTVTFVVAGWADCAGIGQRWLTTGIVGLAGAAAIVASLPTQWITLPTGSATALGIVAAAVLLTFICYIAYPPARLDATPGIAGAVFGAVLCAAAIGWADILRLSQKPDVILVTAATGVAVALLFTAFPGPRWLIGLGAVVGGAAAAVTVGQTLFAAELVVSAVLGALVSVSAVAMHLLVSGAAASPNLLARLTVGASAVAMSGMLASIIVRMVA